MLLALFNGASLLTVTDQIKRSPWKLSDVLLIRNQVTVLQLTPSLFYHLPLRDVVTRLLGDQSCVKVLAFGGERCPSLRLLAQYKSISVSSAPKIISFDEIYYLFLEFDTHFQYLWYN